MPVNITISSIGVQNSLDDLFVQLLCYYHYHTYYYKTFVFLVNLLMTYSYYSYVTFTTTPITISLPLLLSLTYYFYVTVTITPTAMHIPVTITASDLNSAGGSNVDSNIDSNTVIIQ